MVGYNGTAEPREPLNEGGEDLPLKVELEHEPLSDTFKVEESKVEELSTEGLSLMTKLIILGLILGACYAFIKANSPRRTPAGRHGAYP